MPAAHGRFVSVSVEGRELLVGICNKNPQGGALGRQIKEVEKEAGGRTPVLVRCSEYPANPRSLEATAAAVQASLDLRDNGGRLPYDN